MQQSYGVRGPPQATAAEELGRLFNEEHIGKQTHPTLLAKNSSILTRDGRDGTPLEPKLGERRVVGVLQRYLPDDRFT